MISVIIPSLNEEKYIESTLKALRNQDYKHRYEIIVVDGGSEDKTVKIVKKYADKVIVMGRGIAKARNMGAKAAKGDILFFVDADTMLLFNNLSEIGKSFKDKKVVAATCPVIPISSLAKDFLIYWAYSQYMKASIKRKRAEIAGFCFACRKSMFNKLGGYDESMETGEDFDLSRKFSKAGSIKFIESTFSMTSPRRIQKWGRIKGVSKHLEFYLKRIINGNPVGIKKYGHIR